jgi:hypothetical protein
LAFLWEAKDQKQPIFVSGANCAQRSQLGVVAKECLHYFFNAHNLCEKVLVKEMQTTTLPRSSTKASMLTNILWTHSMYKVKEIFEF